MANKKLIIRNEFLTIKMSKEEKDLWEAYSKQLGIPKTRLARNILMMEANSKINNLFGKHIINAYKYYLKVTNQTEELESINKK